MLDAELLNPGPTLTEGTVALAGRLGGELGPDPLTSLLVQHDQSPDARIFALPGGKRRRKDVRFEKEPPRRHISSRPEQNLYLSRPDRLCPTQTLAPDWSNSPFQHSQSHDRLG